MSEPKPVMVRDVHFRYDGIPVLSDINLTVEPGDFLGILGPHPLRQLNAVDARIERNVEMMLPR